MDEILKNIMDERCPMVRAMYERYQRDKEENLYKVGGIFYTTKPGYGSSGKRVKITDIEDKDLNGIKRRVFNVKEVNENGRIIGKDLGAGFPCYYERVEENDERLAPYEGKSMKYYLYRATHDEYLGVYFNLMPEDEYKKLEEMGRYEIRKYIYG